MNDGSNKSSQKDIMIFNLLNKLFIKRSVNMGNSGLKQHIETAQKTGVLKLSPGKLNQFPPGFQQLEGCLRTLDLSDNKFVVLPPEISRFMQLRHLNLGKNKLSKLPDSIGALTRLETFNACENTLTSIPRTFSNLIHLKQELANVEGYDAYMDRFTAVKKKLF
ncbi:hypothetical protein YQE_10747, partial [Dendroctonus ponderosae]